MVGCGGWSYWDRRLGFGIGIPEESGEAPAAPVPAPAPARRGKKVTNKVGAVEDGADVEGDDGDDEDTVELDPKRHGTAAMAGAQEIAC